ncbi:MAG: hypothetical protein HUU60_08695 [Armatimonadetes bacterium]|nr:hypothetical protein [Armatimonadota bacterium]
MPSSSPDDFNQPYRFQAASGKRWEPGLGGYADDSGNFRVAELGTPQKAPLVMPEGSVGIPTEEPYDGFYFTDEGLYLDANGRQLPRQGKGCERGIAALARLKTAATFAANANPVESVRAGISGRDCWGEEMGYLDRGLSLAGAFPALGALDDGARLAVQTGNSLLRFRDDA